MSNATISACAALLARALAAFERPDEFDEAARRKLVEDICSFQRRLAWDTDPGNADLHIGIINRAANACIHTAPSRGVLLSKLASHCRDWWPAFANKPAHRLLDDETFVLRVREQVRDAVIATFAIRATTDNGRLDDMLAQGRYCVLSTAHLCTATTDLLDRWAVAMPHERPVIVAGGVHGWFVSADDLAIHRLGQLPADLRAAVRFGHARGFDYLLFDCDAACVSGLPVHAW